jgi:CubicO group peptidase (beta-lactamase class C family)
MPCSTRRSFLSGVLAAASCCSAAARPQTSARRMVARQSLIDAERERIVRAMAQADIPGAAVCWLDEGEPRWVEAFGITDRQANHPAKADTIFSIQSTSKNFTATAVMLAVQRGLLDLDEPITTYLPEFSVRSRFEPMPQARMTLRLLLAHRAGFTHEAPVGNNYNPAFPSFEAHVRSISQTWLRYPVGERYRYSNLGFDLAGYILQIRTGMPFAEWLKVMVFEPLGMSDSTAASVIYMNRANRAVGHEEGYVSVPLETPLIPSGGVYTSARDMAAYCRFHINRGKVDGRSVLNDKLWHEMHAFHYGGDYSLGVIRTELRYGSTDFRLMSHRGGGFGFGSVFEYCPEAGLGWVALFNRPASAAYRFGEPLIDQTLTRRFGPRKPRRPAQDMAPIIPPPASLQSYVGTYVGRNVTVDIATSQRSLLMRDRATSSTLRFLSPSKLFIVDPDGDTVIYEYYAGSALEPAHLECFIGENSLDYNQGPYDALGPGKPAWTGHVGAYRIDQWGKEADSVTVHLQNGYLYLNQFRLIIETEPGLFFTSDGEAVDFRGQDPTWKNIRLRRYGLLKP